MWTFGGRFLRNVAAFVKRIAAIITRRQRPSSENAIVEEGKKQAEARKGEEDEEEQMIPLSAGLGVSMVWLLGAGVYFHYLEGWSYGSSIYFLWISITTVGLGDFAPTKYEYTIITYTLLLVGLSLMSMCIAILQAKIESLVKRLQADMLRRRNSLPPGTEPTPEEQKKSNGLLGKIMKNPEEKLLKMMLTTNQRDLVEGNDKKSQSLHNVRTQTRTPATVTTVKLCDQHRHYAENSISRNQIVINEGDEITLTNSSGKKSFKNQFAQIATEELYVLADDSLRETPVGGDCIICRALEDAKPPTPLPPPPTPPKSASPVIEKPKWRM
uniref:Potassium channel domain-containing protein n=1 Tax=Plectus sambesii TaxID=2011161 RepID=A0A914UJG0_9BILA